MLEIIILIILCSKIGKIVESKGRKKIGYQFMLVGMWLGGELFGGILGGIVGALVLGNEDGATLLGIAAALVCAITGAVIAFQIAKNLEPAAVEDEFYRDMDYVDREDVREHFRPRPAVDRPPPEAYTDNPEEIRRPKDDRIQP